MKFRESDSEIDMLAPVVRDEFADLIDDLIAMGLTQQVRGIDVLLFDRLDHVFMLGHISFRQPVREGQVVEAKQSAPFVKEPRKEGRVEGISASFRDGSVELAI